LPLPRKPKFKAVLFDLDGTLIEFKFDVKGSRIAMIDWLAKNGFDTDGLWEMKTQEIMLNVKSQCNRQQNSDYSAVHARLSSILDEYEYKAFAVARPHPGSLKLLKELKSDQIRCGLVTNSGGKPVKTLLNEFGFLPYLACVITRDEVENLKPDPEGVLRAMREMSLSQNDTVYVGDSILDIQAAKEAGIACIALAQGLYKSDDLARRNPDFLIERIEQVTGIIFPQSKVES
jgi:HAD superfamily hydrolase (TIGR01509 family)